MHTHLSRLATSSHPNAIVPVSLIETDLESIVQQFEIGVNLSEVGEDCTVQFQPPHRQQQQNKEEGRRASSKYVSNDFFGALRSGWVTSHRARFGTG